jgi:hypothetical protein
VPINVLPRKNSTFDTVPFESDAAAAAERTMFAGATNVAPLAGEVIATVGGGLGGAFPAQQTGAASAHTKAHPKAHLTAAAAVRAIHRPMNPLPVHAAALQPPSGRGS